MKTQYWRAATVPVPNAQPAPAQSNTVFRWLVAAMSLCIVVLCGAALALLRAADKPAQPRLTRQAETARPADEPAFARSSLSPITTDVIAPPQSGAEEHPFADEAKAPSNPFPAEESPDTTPEQMRNEVAARLRASGPAGAWSIPAAALFGNWQKKAAPELARKVQVDPMQCFRTGCFTTVTYDDLQTYQQFEQSFTTSEAFYGWPGMKHRTSPDPQKSGSFMATWVFFNPEFDPSTVH